ncbi:disease resistance protein RPV1-like [Eucalyptus grandis]|uniref:disease resistance protein RPV1-like n=1 Tax=Eucalyptus grandis TaxID=71139 RepID=UPI00192EEAB4|nr:disease resistance protein RPV1-like [Eucalyptus grandis]XP_039162394.1 disease resistance protein RPV1-like [Eucalyptus grandis]
MEKGQSQSKANKRMHRFNLGRPFAVFNHLKKKKNGAEKESIEGASISSFISSIPTGGGSDQYDIFLSFRGSDTRKGFTDHLYRSLINVGTVPISVFKDDNSLEIGKDFDSEILDIITQSKISIPIISENYASSKWCLRELVRIMDCKKSMSHMVLPIFYKVNPSDVRYLKGKFGEAFHMRKKRFDEKDIQEGRQALTEVSYLNGWESEKFSNGHEGELVEEVIKTILSKLRHDFQLDVPKHLVGVGDHVNKIRNWVDTPASHARMIGIYGMGGIGKTTLAKVIYNELLNDFLHRSFLPDIRETAHHNGILYLQNLLIKEILPNEHQVCKVDDGISLIKSRFKGKRVLILLDDVDHQDQLNALARERDWFSTGSIIIVTTRYEAILDQPEFQADYKYELSELDEVHSLLLFKRHAFHMGHCSKDFEGISRDILSTMGGLPLAIKVIGSYLYGKTNGKVWQDILKKLRNEPAKDVQKILMISYDALEPEHKNIFLDIACFFIGEDSKFAIYTWEDFYPYQGIEELKLRCLIKIGDRGEFRMHDQLRDLGRSIFCQGQSLERCLKQWVDQEGLTVKPECGARYCLKNYDTYFQWPRGCSPAYTSEQFKNLPSSRFLQLCWKALSGDFNELFSELRWLRWFYIEPNMLSSAINFHLSKLVVLELSQNKLAEDWSGWSSIMVAKRLKVLNLSYSQVLRCTPDFSTFTELEILILDECCKLEQVHPSIGQVKRLVSLYLRNCLNLKELPEEVGELQELKELLLDDAGITKIPMSIGSLKKLQKLSVPHCLSLVEIPLSIDNLSSLQHLDLSSYSLLSEISRSNRNLSSLECFNLLSSIGNLSSLRHLNLSQCSSLRDIPSSIGNLSSLQHLNLSQCLSLRDIPSSVGNLSSPECFNLLSSVGNLSSPECFNLLSSIGNLSSLRHLNLSQCSSLRDIPSSIGNLSSLQHLNLSQCSSLRDIPSSVGNLSSLLHLNLSHCSSLREIPNSIGNLSSLQYLNLSHCSSLREIPTSIGDLHKLQHLNIDNPLIKEIPDAIGRFKELRRIIIISHDSWGIGSVYCSRSLSKIIDTSLSTLPDCKDKSFLQNLLSQHFKVLRLMPKHPFGLTYLQYNFAIPKFLQLSCLIDLEELHLYACDQLESIQGLPSRLLKFCVDSCPNLILPELGRFKYLEELSIRRCNFIKRTDLSQWNRLKELDIQDCDNLVEIQGHGELEFLETINIYSCMSIERLILPKLQCLK